MHVAVLGAGIIGVTTAYYLSRSRHRVTIVDRALGVAHGASYANGGQLSYSFTDAFAQPSILSSLPTIAFRRDPAVRVGSILDPAFVTWSARFIAQCTRERARSNTLHTLRLALQSRHLLDELRSHVPIDFGFRKAGKLVLLRNPKALRSAARMLQEKRDHGCSVECLSRSEALAVEPAIGAMDDRFCGGFYGESDGLGDSRLFAEGLYRWLLENTDTQAHFGTNVHGLDINGSGFRGLLSDRGTIAADAVVMCLGAYSTELARNVGLSGRILPVRGYSVNLPPGSTPPSCSVTDVEKRILFSPLQPGVRVTGFVDFLGLTVHRDSDRIRTLKRVAEQVAPAAADYRAAADRGWGGFRAMTPDGKAIVGATAVPGVFANMGHGALGWTLACASACEAAAAVDRCSNTIRN